MILAFSSGFLLSFGLILAIGAQNAFVLQQGLKKEHVGAIVAFCALADAILITLGVYGAGRLIESIPALGIWLTILGAAFLFFYGISRFISAFKGEHFSQSSTRETRSLKTVLIMCASFTFLNPHVYLDTWVLMGALSLPYEGASKLLFTLGASLASLIFFFSLGFGARLLSPLFQSPRAWQILDFMIGLMMLIFAYALVKTLII